VLSDAIAALAVEAQRAHVRIALRAPSAEHGRARVVSGDVSQIVTNLVMNALAHAPAQSEVTVALTAGESHVTIDVVDAGPGVEATRRASIFEGDSARRGGAGVGLRHARAMARAAGGDLELVPGDAGAHFRLTWPRADALPPAPRSVPRMHLFEGTHVLVVEDDLHVSQLLESALVARGAVVTVARTAAELAAALASPGPPHDAVLIDLSPIQSNPVSAITSLRERAPDAMMVVISGSAEELPEPLRDESVRFVRKPFEVGEIVSALAQSQVRR
jgi:CheY-like chemotaxis protein/anti-sigma regulatory factor (Ser/Thr protein kinase)